MKKTSKTKIISILIVATLLFVLLSTIISAQEEEELELYDFSITTIGMEDNNFFVSSSPIADCSGTGFDDMLCAGPGLIDIAEERMFYKPNLLYLDGRFMSCNLDDFTYSEKSSKLQHESKELQNINQNCFVAGSWFCNANNWQWQPVNKYDSSALITAGTALKNDPTGEEGCCPTNWCWHSPTDTCVKNQKGEFTSLKVYNFTDTQDYRCIDGVWRETYLKWDWLMESYAYCDFIDQCYVSRTLSPTGTAQCVNPGNWQSELKERYCYSGNWSTRTKLIALQLINISESNNNGKDDYTVFCDSLENALNEYKEYFFGFDEEVLDAFQLVVEEESELGLEEEELKYDPEFVNNFCVLDYQEGQQKIDRKVVLGTSLNIGLEDKDNSFLSFILNKPVTYCDDTLYGRSYILLNGQEDFVQVNMDDSELKREFNTDAITIMFWINANSIDGNEKILIDKEAWVIKINTDNKIVATITAQDETQASLISTTQIQPSTSSSEKWYHIAMTYNGGNHFALYINATKESSYTEFNKPLLDLGTKLQPIYIGRNPYVPNSAFDGKIDELKIYSFGLVPTGTETPSLIQTEYSFGNQELKPPLQKTNLIAYYSFDSDARDFSGKGNHGLLMDSAKIIGLPNEFRPCSPVNEISDVYYNPSTNLILFSSTPFTVIKTPLEMFLDRFETFVYNPFKAVSDFFIGLYTGKEFIASYTFTEKVADFNKLYIGKLSPKIIRAVLEKKIVDGLETPFLLVEYEGFETDMCSAIISSLQGKLEPNKFSCQDVII